MSYAIAVSRMIKCAARIVGFGLLIKVSALLKASYIVGSHALFFSGTNIAVPVVGALAGSMSSVVLFLMRLFLYGSAGLSVLALTIPGLCASLYWSVAHWSVRLIVPLACFVAFVVHPVGAQAFSYALYWLIPVGLYFVPHKNIFLTALASTFTAHAVGSVIWLYTVPMTAGMWIALIPLVAFERLCFASGMVVLYHAIQTARACMKHAVGKLAYRPYRTAQQ